MLVEPTSPLHGTHHFAKTRPDHGPITLFLSTLLIERIKGDLYIPVGEI